MVKFKKIHIFLICTFVIFLYVFLSIFSSISTFRVSSEESVLDPSFFGLEFEEIDINTSQYDANNLIISSWWIPNNSNKTMLVLHGLRSQKSDELILKFIKEFHDLGFSIIAIDFRNHGKSSVGDFTFGLDEINDVYATLEYYYEFKDVEKVGIWGFSYGATTAVFSGLKIDSYQFSNDDNNNLYQLNTEIVGIFSDTPYFSLTDLISSQISRRTPLNLFFANLLKPGILVFTDLFYDFDFNSIEENYELYSAINIPTKIIGCLGDLTVPLDQPIRANQSLGQNSSIIEFEGCKVHGEAFDSAPSRYLEAFDKHFADLF